MDTLPLVAPEQVGLSAARLDRVRKWMHQWVDSGRLAGMVTVVMRKGQLAFAETVGKADLERDKPMRPDTIFRIYSMTKPLTSTAIMMLYEEGRFQLDDPISKFIPAFKDPRVFAGGSRGKIDSVPAEREITFRDLLTHTSGLTYGFMESNPVHALYRAKENGVDFQTSETSLKQVVEQLATFPLIAQPGKAWNYSVATDVLGYLVEVISGQPFQVYLKEKVIDPLGMVDTDFFVPTEQARALRRQLQRRCRRKARAARRSGQEPLPQAAQGEFGRRRPGVDRCGLSAFLPHDAEQGRARWRAAARPQDGRADDHEPSQGRHGRHGHAALQRIDLLRHRLRAGLQPVPIDPAKAHILGTPGEFAWAGAASTAFWIDPVEDMAVILLTQLMPSSTYPIRRELRVLTYQAIVD